MLALLLLISTDHAYTQVAEGMNFLHSSNGGIVHRDLKPENILLNEHLVAKIADFGISREAVTRRATTGASAAGDGVINVQPQGYATAAQSKQQHCMPF